MRPRDDERQNRDGRGEPQEVAPSDALCEAALHAVS
jgi:hypothetical protein